MVKIDLKTKTQYDLINKLLKAEGNNAFIVIEYGKAILNSNIAKTAVGAGTFALKQIKPDSFYICIKTDLAASPKDAIHDAQEVLNDIINDKADQVNFGINDVIETATTQKHMFFFIELEGK